MKRAKKCLLIIEDDPGLQSQLRWSFDEYDVHVAGDSAEAMAMFRRHEPAVVTLDLGLPPEPEGTKQGLNTLEQILALVPTTKIIVVTGSNDRSSAVESIGLGAYDFCQKPVDPEMLSLIIQRAFHVFELERENKKLHRHLEHSPLDGVVASSPQMLKICRSVEKIASTNATTLLLGESGTGKELLARAIHDLSPRAARRFVALNCAAIPENLLESELFGYEKGAFTGALRQTVGKIEYADGGTLFLDEIGDLPLAMQAKLLRFLQGRVVERLGGRKEIPVDVRVVCATNQNLDGKIKVGEFREDLFYRVSEITIRIPPVRERTGDAVLIARSLFDRFTEQLGREHTVKGFSKQGIQAIAAYSWPGNVREIENRVKRAVIMAESSHIAPDDMELEMGDGESMPLNLREVRDQAEKEALLGAMAQCDGNISRAAEILGISRPTLYDLLHKHGLKMPG